MIAFPTSDSPKRIRLPEPVETIIVPSNRERIDIEEGPNGELLKLIIYTRIRMRKVKSRWYQRFWR